MATRLLFSMVLCFLRAEPTNGGVTQTPRSKVTEKGQEATLTCEPISGHNGVFWYKQTTVRGMEFLISFQNQKPIDDTGMPKERFSAQMPSAKLSTLKIQTTQPQDSAVYLCASSLATELQNHIRLGQKPYASPSLSISQKQFSAVILGTSQNRKDVGLMSCLYLEKTRTCANEHHIEDASCGEVCIWWWGTVGSWFMGFLTCHSVAFPVSFELKTEYRKKVIPCCFSISFT